jgi:RHS repeat-associated protein
MATGDKYVMDGAFLSCDKGVIPTRFMVTPKPVLLYDAQIANEADRIPLTNILPFGVCQVTRTPCVPAPIMWDRVADTGITTLGARPLLDTSKCMCGVGGKINIHLNKADADAAVALDQQMDKIDEAAEAAEEASGWAFWGGLAMGIGGALLVATGVGAPLGAAMITGAGYLMTTSTVLATGAAVAKGATKFARDPSKEVGLAIVGEVAFEAAKNFVMQKLGGKLIEKIAKSGLGKRVLNSPFAKKMEDRFATACRGNRAPQSKCGRVGEPVDVATGKVINEGTDFELAGPLPLVWSRTWYSTSTHDGALGRGWHHAYDEEIFADDEVVIIRLSDGRYTGSEALALGESVYLREDKITLTREPSGAYICVDGDGIMHSFAYCEVTDSYKLVRLTKEAAQTTIAFAYSAAGHLTSIVDSAGRLLTIQHDVEGRLVAIRTPHPTEPRGVVDLVRYTYDRQSRLILAADAVGQAWRFRYKDWLLVRATYKNGVSFHYTYNGVEPGAQCIRTWGDGGIYACQLHYYPEANQTIVIDSVGAQRVYEYDPEMGVVTRLFDARGGLTVTEYNEYMEVVSITDSLGNETRYEYDYRGNCLLTELPDGAMLQRQFDEQDRLTQLTDTVGGQWQWSYSDQGQVTQRTDPTGRVIRYSYLDGRPHTVSDPITGYLTTFIYDAVGNLCEVRTSDGLSTRWLYDRWSRIYKITDQRGNVQWREYDLLSRTTVVHEPDGNVRRFTYDALDNVIYAEDRTHKIRYAYRGLGRLVQRVESDRVVEFFHDTEERLRAIVNELGLLYRFELDAEGDVITETGFDGRTRHYQRDVRGRITEMVLPNGQRTRYSYDRNSRVTEVVYGDGCTETFSYREDGAMLQAVNDSIAVTFELDILGRVRKEQQGEHSVLSVYNELGQRSGVMSSLGADVQYTHTLSGEVEKISAGNWQALFEHNAQGLEIQRSLSGGVEARWQHDSVGRPIEQRVRTRNHQSTEWVRTYNWQHEDRLARILDSQFGATRYEHDIVGNLSAATFEDGTRELRMPDAVGNLFHTLQREDCQYGLSGELLKSNGIRYFYDEVGNLSRKITSQDEEWNYTWNSAGRLSEVIRPDGGVVRLTYDALGRRIRKSYRGQTTYWVWDGHKPLHEWSQLELDGQNTVDIVTWLFEEQSFAPIAKLTEQHNFSVVSDHMGTPLAMYDQHGTQAWQQQLNTYGAIRQGKGQKQDCPFRFQGQYEDVETGLYYNRFRYYDPAMGSYISQDPIGLIGGIRPYAYVHDPTTWVDVWGLMPWEPGTPKPKGWRLPKNGTWSGAPGHSNFIPNNPADLGLKDGDTIPFVKGSPDFEPYSVGNLDVPGMTGEHRTDMPLIHQAVADEKNLKNQTAGRNWLSEEGLTPHHAGGSKVQLVPTKLHDGVRHTGGASDLRTNGC